MMLALVWVREGGGVRDGNRQTRRAWSLATLTGDDAFTAAMPLREGEAVTVPGRMRDGCHQAKRLAPFRKACQTALGNVIP